MGGCFLDTTVVIGLSADASPERTKFQAEVAALPPASVANYALRECLNGYVQNVCDVHNRIKAASNFSEALKSLQALNPLIGRKKGAMIQLFADALGRVYEANPEGAMSDAGKELVRELARQANVLWLRARSMKGVDKVQPLACFLAGDLIVGESGELRGPNGGSFGCLADSTVRCAAAAYLSDNPVSLSAMTAALHPDRLDEFLASKNETKQRRKALKELQTLGPKKFSKARCRALGDAYFAAMCPPGASLLTTNEADFVPLCKATACKIVVPK